MFCLFRVSGVTTSAQQDKHCISKATLGVSLTLMVLLLLLFVSVAFYFGMRQKYRLKAQHLDEAIEMPYFQSRH